MPASSPSGVGVGVMNLTFGCFDTTQPGQDSTRDDANNHLQRPAQIGGGLKNNYKPPAAVQRAKRAQDRKPGDRPVPMLQLNLLDPPLRPASGSAAATLSSALHNQQKQQQRPLTYVVPVRLVICFCSYCFHSCSS